MRKTHALLYSARSFVSFFEGIGSQHRAFGTSAASFSPAPPDNGWIPPEASFYPHQKTWHDKYCRQRKVVSLGPRYPAIAQNAYIAPSAVVIGDVDVLDGVSIMHGAVVRGDLNNIKIGYFSSIQENCVIHAARNGPTGLPASTFIGEAVTIGAGSLLRSCRIHEQTVIGERCIIMEGSVVDKMVILQPGTVVPPAKFIPHGEVWGGNPAQFIRKLTHDEEVEIAQLTDSHEKWRELYGVEELPWGSLWKDAEKVDPAEERLHPEGLAPEWACNPQYVDSSANDELETTQDS